MDALQAKLKEIVEGTIDFEGQKAVDTLIHLWLAGTCVLSFVIGFALQDLSLTFKLVGVSTTLLVLVVVPPWPYLKRQPVTWLSSPSDVKKSQ